MPDVAKVACGSWNSFEFLSTARTLPCDRTFPGNRGMCGGGVVRWRQNQT